MHICSKPCQHKVLSPPAGVVNSSVESPKAYCRIADAAVPPVPGQAKCPISRLRRIHHHGAISGPTCQLSLGLVIWRPRTAAHWHLGNTASSRSIQYVGDSRNSYYSWILCYHITVVAEEVGSGNASYNCTLVKSLSRPPSYALLFYPVSKAQSPSGDNK
jgi:hypothetical protein